MTFTIASATREILGTVVAERWRKEKEADDRKAAEYEEVGRLPARGETGTDAVDGSEEDKRDTSNSTSVQRLA